MTEADSTALKLARETLTGDIRDLILGDLKDSKTALPWHLRSEAEQSDMIERVTKLAEGIVERAVKIIAADGRPTIVATLKKAGTNGEFIEGVVRFGKSDALRHEFIDAAGSEVLMVVCGSEAYQGQSKPQYPTPDQKGLFPGDDGDDDGPIFDKTPNGGDQ